MSATPDPAFEELIGLMPFAVGLGITVQQASAEEVSGSMSWSADRCTVSGMLHGGALMSFADSVGAICAYLNLPDGASTSTVESKTNFFRAVREGSVHARSRPLHVGRTFITVQTDLTDDRGRRVAQTTQTQAILTAR